MADDNVTQFPANGNHSTLKPAVKETPEPADQPIITVDELIQRASGQCYAAEHLKRAAGHLEELAMMLCEAQDRGISQDPDTKYLQETAQGIQVLISTQADEIENIAGYIERLAEEAHRLKKSREGGAR